MVADSHARTSSLGRRHLVRLGTAAAGGGVLTVAGGSAALAAKRELPLSPPEDLMREHGLLNRVILIYREVIKRIDLGEEVPRQELGAAASVIRSLIHDHHEHVEERYVFSALLRANRHTSTIRVLLTQHAVGRAITAELLRVDNVPAHRFGRRARLELIDSMLEFIRMYQPHETREDTEIFPAFRAITPPRSFVALSERLREQEYRRFGPMGFERFVGRVVDIEKSLGIHDLAQFTPKRPVKPEGRPGPRPDTRPGARPDAASGAKPDSGARPDAASGARPGARPEARAGARPDAGSGARSETGAAKKP